MNDNVKVALILAATIILSVCIREYLSPFQSCVRSGTAVYYCAKAVGGSAG